ncbi:MAG: isocitrate lyase/phosphoenolpyruvate mutase family protein [Dehalococcoidia bacterium]
MGYPISVFDPVSARIARHLGAELGILGGSIASAAVLAAPDLILLTLSELADQVRKITRAADVSLMVDADHGYGNALNVMRTVEELESAGASAVTIEDTALPAVFGKAEPELVSIEEMLGKLRSAVGARRAPGLVVIARTGALQYASLSEATRRAEAYARTGVDALMVVGATERKQVEAVRAVTDLPLVLGSTSRELNDEGFLLAHGVRIVLRGHQPFFVAMKALHDAMKHINDGGLPSDLREQAASRDLQDVILKTSEYSRWQRDYLT